MREVVRMPGRRILAASRGLRVVATGTAAALTVTLIVLAAPLTANGDTSVSCGDFVLTDVTLTRDLNCPTTGVHVGRGVTINFAGHTLNGVGTGDFGIEGDGDNTLLNGTITGFRTGVVGSGARIQDITIRQNDTGIDAGPGGVTVVDSSIVANAGAGILTGGATIRDSRILNNGRVGMIALQGATVTGTIVANNGGHGMSTRAQGLTLLNSTETLDDDLVINNDVRINTPYGDSHTLTNSQFVNSVVNVDGDGVPSRVYVMNDRFVNSLLAVDTGAVIVDQGGNGGNSCAPDVSCTG
jgi:parallel beta helix pectate lyase-like protein